MELRALLCGLFVFQSAGISTLSTTVPVTSLSPFFLQFIDFAILKDVIPALQERGPSSALMGTDEHPGPERLGSDYQPIVAGVQSHICYRAQGGGIRDERWRKLRVRQASECERSNSK